MLVWPTPPHKKFSFEQENSRASRSITYALLDLNVGPFGEQ
jgi:hypothetical protein